MPANIHIRDGVAQAWYAGQPPWHGLGTVTERTKTAKQVIKQVPLFSRPVETRPVYVNIGGRHVESEQFVATVRKGDDYAMGMVSHDYTVLQDRDGLLTMEAVVNATRRTSFASAFGLGNGSRVAASIDLSRVVNLRIKRDPSKQQAFLFGTWAHDGTGALNVGLYQNRVDCQNMLNMATARAKAQGLLVSIRHTGDVTERLREAQEILGFVEVTAQAHKAEMDALADIPVDRKFIPEFTEELIPIPEDMKRPASREDARSAIAFLFRKSENMVDVPQSAYRLHQAVVEYADHWRPLRIGEANDIQVAERRFRTATEGAGADLKTRSLELLRQQYMGENKANRHVEAEPGLVQVPVRVR
jgi:phage/plasmid-like protein (TIGR03299 family)